MKSVSQLYINHKIMIKGCYNSSETAKNKTKKAKQNIFDAVHLKCVKGDF